MFGLLKPLRRARTSMVFAVIGMGGSPLMGARRIVGLGGIGFAIASFVVHLGNLALFHVAQGLVPSRMRIPVLPARTIAIVVGAAARLVQVCVPASNPFVYIAKAPADILLYPAELVTTNGPATEKNEATHPREADNAT